MKIDVRGIVGEEAVEVEVSTGAEATTRM